MSELKTCWVDDRLAYDGTQLRSLFAYLEYGVQGDSVIAWRGSCDIPFEHMVDGEDLLEQSEIRGGDMVHFIFEFFGQGLSFAVAFQRLFAGVVRESLIEASKIKDQSGVAGNQKSADFSDSPDQKSNLETLARSLNREGDDLFLQDGKLSISIATVSPVSAMIHFAVNVSNEGTPVKTSSLNDLGLEVNEFTEVCLKRASEEFKTLMQATKKVQWVR